jgi:hypothetical protein
MDDFNFIEAYYNDPVGFCYDVLKVEELEEEQIKVLERIVKYNRIAIKSGHGIGKTALLSFIIIWFLMTRVDCRIPMTSPSQHQLYDILIPELVKWRNNGGMQNIIGITSTKIWVKGYEKSWFGPARACKKGENISGFHGNDMLIVIEEASGVEQEVIEPLEGALTQKDNKIIIIGNPTKLSGVFYDAFHRDRDIWETFTFSGENSNLVDKAFVERMARYGKDSDIYRVRVKGEFPKGEPDTFITLDIVEDATNREIVEKWDLVSIGVDPARFGDDESVICWRKGLNIQPLESFYGIDTTRLTGEIIRVCRGIYKSGYKKRIEIKVDDTGIGAGVTDQLNQQKTIEERKAIAEQEFCIEVVPVINNGVATNPEFKDYGSQMWGEMKEALKTISIPDDDNLIAQLSTRKYKIEPDGKIKMEKKDDMKKRKLPSPDRADALALCLAPANYFNFDNDRMEGQEGRNG